MRLRDITALLLILALAADLRLVQRGRAAKR